MSKADSIHESSRDIPVTGEYDVVIVGGGMAGVAASLAAARHSARVCLLERYGALGGLATLGNVTVWLPLCDGRGNQVIGGLGEELLKLSVADLKKDDPAAHFKGVPDCWKPGGDLNERRNRRYLAEFNPAAYLLALEERVIHSGVKIFYDTRFCSVRHEGTAISHVIVENKSGRSALACQVVVDATGDADVCHAAGEETVSLDTNVPAGWFYTLTNGELRLHEFSNRYSPDAGRDDAEGPFFRGDEAEQVTQHLVQTRAQIRKRLAALRDEHSGNDVQVLMPPTIACFRMTRRLAGRFTLTEAHRHQWFDDTIGLTGDWRQAGPVYAIPLRALRGVRTNNLLVAGRCISVDNTAWDVLRAIPPCVVTGEATGTVAALAAIQTGGNPDALDYSAVRTRLLEQGVILDPERVATQSDK